MKALLQPIRKSVLIAFVAQFMVYSYSKAQTSDVEYIKGSTKRIEQLIGNWDFKDRKPTSNQTQTLYNLGYTDLGIPFQHHLKTYILFGDCSCGVEPSRDLDPIAYTTDNNPDDGLNLNFITTTPNSHQWKAISIPGVDSQTVHIPVEAVSTLTDFYLYFVTDATNSHLMKKSIVAVSHNDGQTFSKLYDFSSNHFINISIVENLKSNDWNGFPPEIGNVMAIFGSGEYRKSDVFLAFQNMSNLTTGQGVYYFAGVNGDGNPMWTPYENNAVPLFHQPVVGELSISFNQFLQKWLLTYNSLDFHRGINFRTSDKPWGPWSEPNVLFEPIEDSGYCYFMHDSLHNCPNISPNPYTDVQGDAPHDSVAWGGEYGPYQYPLFAKSLNPGETTIYFNMSTWNPYTVVLMKSTLKLSDKVLSTTPPSCANSAYSLVLNWNFTATDLWIDISTDPLFNSVVYNKNVNNLNSTNAPAGFSGGLSLIPGQTYYWRIWNGITRTHTSGRSFKVSNCNASPLNLQISDPAYSNTPYSKDFSWTGYNTGWWIDISTDPTFTTYSHKNIDNLTTTRAPEGFSPSFSFQPNTTYYWRIWNGTSWTYGSSFSGCLNNYHVCNTVNRLDYKSAGKLYAGGACITSIPLTNPVTFTANDFIQLLPGFSVPAGGEFTAYIQPCLVPALKTYEFDISLANQLLQHSPLQTVSIFPKK